MFKSKKLFSCTVACLILALILGVSVCLFATGTSYTAHAEELPQNVSEEVVDEAPVEPAEDPTFFDRVWEFIVGHAAEILTVIGNVILIAYMIAKNVKSKKKLIELGTNIITVKDDVASTVSSQKSVVSVTNELIEGYNRFEKALNNFDATENERYKTMLAAFAQTKAILEILTTVYANSKNIPQGVKDLVNLKYADVLKLVGDEDKLKEIAEQPSEGEGSEAEVGESAEG